MDQKQLIDLASLLLRHEREYRGWKQSGFMKELHARAHLALDTYPSTEDAELVVELARYRNEYSWNPRTGTI